MKLILLAIGGAAGTILRYYLSSSIQANNATLFPWGTFSVNLIGSLIIGIIAGVLINQTLSEQWQLFIFVGVLGGFTTFSSLAIETFNLLRTGQYIIATTYMLSTNFFGLLLAAAGFMISKKLFIP